MKRALIVGLVLGLAALAGWSLIQPAPVVPVAAPEPSAFSFVDESLVWDWSVTCTDELTFLPKQDVTFTLTDDAEGLVLGVAHPDATNPDALVLTGCAEDACRLAVSRGEPGPALDVALSVAMAYGVQRTWGDRTKEAWEKRGEWEWADYEPLIVQADGGWVASCVEVKDAAGSK